MPANEAVSVHPGIEYALVYLKESEEVLIIATELVNDAMSRYGIEVGNFEILGFAKGADFGWVREETDVAPFSVKHPFMPVDDGAAEKFVPIIHNSLFKSAYFRLAYSHIAYNR